MSYFNGFNKKKSYFEGWYFKHQGEDTSIALIPGFNIYENGEKSAFIQVITPGNSYNFQFPYGQFHADRDKLDIRIAENRFTEQGIYIDLRNEKMAVKGEIKYGEFLRPKGNIMGPFRFVPFMQCNHGVISMIHRTRGALLIKDRFYNFDGGTGYIETDWGTSFPESYLWTQMNSFENIPCGVMVSVADIPFAGLHFRGCIGCVFYGNEEYRLATYNGVKVEKYGQNGAVLSQGKYRLEVEAKPESVQKLLAPSGGNMSRVIRESLSCEARAKFYIKGSLLFDLKSRNAGFEFVK